jgi:hypothetical protein
LLHPPSSPEYVVVSPQRHWNKTTKINKMCALNIRKVNSPHAQ